MIGSEGYSVLSRAELRERLPVLKVGNTEFARGKTR